MIEDALKSTRALHRIIMTVALVTIVFALSISLPEEKASQKKTIDGLIATDFVAYDDFWSSKVEETRLAVLKPLSDQLASDLEAMGYLVFGLETLAGEFAKPIHIGRLHVNELILNEVSNASIVSLNALNGLSLGANVQILVPRTEELLKEIAEFLAENPRAGRRVETIRITIGDFDFAAESFLPGDQTTVGIYFELLDPVRTGAAPAFSANFIADIVEIEDSSFLVWLQSQSFGDTLVSFDGDEVAFVPELQSAPKGFINEKLGVLSLQLANELSKSSPASQSVSILGTNIPGALAIFASPIVLLALSYYFAAHTGHLTRIAEKDRDSFEEFSWLPISLESGLTFPLSDKVTFHLPFGIMECFSSAILLPVASMGLLYFRLQAFGGLPMLQTACLAAAAIGIMVFGTVTLRNIMLVRQTIFVKTDSPTAPPELT